MKRLIISLLLALFVLPAQADVEFTVSNTNPGSQDHNSEIEYKLSVGDEVYAWASYANYDHMMITQSMGDIAVIGAGVGFQESLTERLSVYAEFGLGYAQPDYKERVEREVTYYKFVREGFGHPPFLEEPGNFYDLEYQNEVQEYGFLGRIGVKYRVTDRLSLNAGYMTYQLGQYISIFNPDLNGGFDRENPDACACKWEGKSRVNLNSFQFGVSWKF